MNKPLVKSLVSTLVHDLLGDDFIARYFTPLSAAAGQYYAFSSAVTLDGDFIIEFETYSSFTGAQMVVGNSGGSSNCVFITAEDLSVRDSTGTTISTAGDSIPNGQLNRTKLVKSGTTLTVFINEVSITSGTFGNIVIDRVGVRQSNSFPFDGYIANLKITKAGTLVVDAALDENFATTTIAKNKQTILGIELWVSPSLNDWTESDGVYSLAGDGSLQWLNIGSLSSSAAYEVTFNVTAIDLACKVQTSAGGDLTFDAAGIYSVLVTGATAIGFSRNGSNTVNISIADISIKEVPAATPYLTTTNINTPNLFELNATYDWLGVDLWINPTLGADWTDNGGGSYTIVSTGDFETLQVSSGIVGSTFLGRYTINSIVVEAGQGLSFRADSNVVISTTAGSVITEFTPTSANLRFNRDQPSKDLTATISDVRMQERLEIAS